MDILEALIKKGILSEKQAKALTDEAVSSGQNIEQILLKRGVAEQDILVAKGEYFGIPVKNLEGVNIPGRVLNYIPEDSAFHYRFIPISVTDEVLEVGIVDPDDIEARDALNFISSKTGMPFKVVLITTADFERLFKLYKGLTTEVSKSLTELEIELKSKLTDGEVTEKSDSDKTEVLTDLYRGIGVNKDHIKDALRTSHLEDKKFDDFDSQDTKKFATHLRKISKPTLIVANKIDIEGGDKTFDRLRERYIDMIVVPASADSELSLRRAEQKGLIKYSPGSEQFEIINQDELNDKQKSALEFIKKGIMGEYMRTGVQFAINIAVFKLLKMNSVYPVANEKYLSDKKGRVLPDLILMKDGATVTDLAKEIHTDLPKGLLYGKDLRYNLRLPVTYQLRDRDVICLVSASKK